MVLSFTQPLSADVVTQRWKFVVVGLLAVDCCRGVCCQLIAAELSVINWLLLSCLMSTDGC